MCVFVRQRKIRGGRERKRIKREKREIVNHCVKLPEQKKIVAHKI